MTKRLTFAAGLVLVLLSTPWVLRASPSITVYVEEPAEEKALRRSVRELPGLVERWRCNCRPKAVALEDGVVYVLGYRRLFALDANDGTVVWDGGPEEHAAPPASGLVLLEDRVAAIFGQELVLRDRASGLEIVRIDLGGRVEELEGPPLVVSRSVPDSGGAEEILRIDASSGQILARQIFAKIPSLVVLDSKIYVTRFGDRGQRLSRLDPETLTTVAEWAVPAGHVLPASEGRIQFSASRLDGFTLHALDPSVGEWSETRIDAHGARAFVSEAGLAHYGAGHDGQSRGLMRFDAEDGTVLWSTSLPCRPGATRFDADVLVVSCGWTRGGAGLLLRLDAGSGEVIETLHGPTRVHSIHRAGDGWLLATSEAVMLVDRERRSPPLSSTEPVDVAVDRILNAIRESFPGVDADRAEALLILGPRALPVMTERLPKATLAQALALSHALGEAGHQPAAPAIASRLDALLEADGDPRGGDQAWRTLLQALARVGGAEEAPVVGRALLDEELSWRVREEAAFALVSFDDPAVLPWLDRFAEKRGKDANPLVEVAESRSAAGPPDEEDASIRHAIRRHLASFELRERGASPCPPGESPTPPQDPSSSPGCVTVEIQELDEVEGARKAAADLPLEEGDRQYVATIHQSWSPKLRLVRVRQIGDRWLVRSIWHWVN